MQIRLAEIKDIDQLIQMRWDFTLEDYELHTFKRHDYQLFVLECRQFLESAISSNHWFIWVAEEEEKIISHIYLELIHKVPRPGRVTHPFIYMTNVYTVKDARNKGIGSQLITTINEWVENKHYEFIIVWPSEESTNYYQKNGYIHCKEPMEFFPETK